MTKRIPRIGDVYRTKNDGDANGKQDIIINKVENGNDAGGYVYWRSPIRVHNRVNQHARVWWIQDYCILQKKVK